MEMYVWNSLILLSKAIFYAGLASIAGCAFLCLPSTKTIGEKSSNSHYMSQLNKYLMAVLSFTLITVPLWFLAKVGAFSENGISGMMDPFIMGVIWDSPVGDVALVRFLTVAMAVITLLLFMQAKINTVFTRFFLIISVGIGIYSFTLMGHVAEKGILGKFILSSHVAIMAWWFGSLVPLKLVTKNFSFVYTQEVMSRFGKTAGYFVTALILLGLYMAYEIFTKWEQIIGSIYGLTFLAKLMIVSLLLIVAARHKFLLVPKLSSNEGLKKLEHSINTEIILACLLLIVTSSLTSVIGPDFT